MGGYLATSYLFSTIECLHRNTKESKNVILNTDHALFIKLTKHISWYTDRHVASKINIKLENKNYFVPCPGRYNTIRIKGCSLQIQTLIDTNHKVSAYKILITDDSIPSIKKIIPGWDYKTDNRSSNYNF